MCPGTRWQIKQVNHQQQSNRYYSCHAPYNNFSCSALSINPDGRQSAGRNGVTGFGCKSRIFAPISFALARLILSQRTSVVACICQYRNSARNSRKSILFVFTLIPFQPCIVIPSSLPALVMRLRFFAVLNKIIAHLVNNSI